MFTITIQEHKMRQEESIREARHQRLIRSAAQSPARQGRITRTIRTWVAQLLIP
jgi:hypothetical protein